MRAGRIFLAGTGTGAVLALMFARQSGKKTRQLIVQEARQRWNQVAAAGKGVRKGLRDLADKAKQQQQRAAAFAAGKQG